jgi:hypothetical protein
MAEVCFMCTQGGETGNFVVLIPVPFVTSPNKKSSLSLMDHVQVFKFYFSGFLPNVKKKNQYDRVGLAREPADSWKTAAEAQ